MSKVKVRNIHIIKTEAGSNILPPRKKVLVRVGERYVPREAKALNPGDKVRWRREFIQKTLDEVDAVLSTNSQRYIEARETVMEQNSARVWIPKLRIHLLSALTDATKAQIMLEDGADLSPEATREAVNTAHEAILNYSSTQGMDPVAWDTVANWVSGRTIAPFDKRFFAALSPINPVFTQIATDFERDGPWAQAYELYVNLRKIAMAYLADTSAENGKNSPKKRKPPSQKLKFGEELTSLVETFEDEKKNRWIDSEVLENEPLKLNTKKISSRKKDQPQLFRGIVKLDDPDLGEIDVDVIDNYSLVDIFGDANLEDFEAIIECAKNFVLSRGFSYADLQERLLRFDVATETILVREIGELRAKAFLEENGLGWREMARIQNKAAMFATERGSALETRRDSQGNLVQVFDAEEKLEEVLQFYPPSEARIYLEANNILKGVQEKIYTAIEFITGISVSERTPSNDPAVFAGEYVIGKRVRRT